MMIYNTKEMYRCSYKEVFMILMGFSMDELKKIPVEKVKFFYDNMDNSYEYNINYDKPLQNQEMSDITKAILANLYRDYLVSDDEKQKIIKNERKELELLEIEKRKKYNPDNIFNNNSKPVIQQIQPISQENSLICMKEGIFLKFIKKIKSFLNIK